MQIDLAVIVLGVLEGVTEFLPISSTGHLLVMEEALGFVAPPGKVFEIVIQLGAIAAIVVLYWQQCLRLLVGFFSEKSSRSQCYALLLAFLPAAVLGFLVHDIIVTHLFHPLVVAISLIVGGLVMIYAERGAGRDKIKIMAAIPLRTALIIGIFQAFAMIPGVSRSGATIIGARLLGVSRIAAAEFSFFLAIPTMLGASAYSLHKNQDLLASSHLWIIGLGAGVAFLTAIVVVKWLLHFIKHHSFVPFALYRIALGSLILGWLYM